MLTKLPSPDRMSTSPQNGNDIQTSAAPTANSVRKTAGVADLLSRI